MLVLGNELPCTVVMPHGIYHSQGSFLSLCSFPLQKFKSKVEKVEMTTNYNIYGRNMTTKHWIDKVENKASKIIKLVL